MKSVVGKDSAHCINPRYYIYNEEAVGVHTVHPDTKVLEIYLVGGGGGGAKCAIEDNVVYPGPGGGGGSTVYFSTTEIPHSFSYCIARGGLPGEAGLNTLVMGIPLTGDGLMAFGGSAGNPFTSIEDISNWRAGKGGQNIDDVITSFSSGIMTFVGEEGPEPVINGYRCRGGGTYFGKGSTFGKPNFGAGGAGGYTDSTNLLGQTGANGLIIVKEY